MILINRLSSFSLRAILLASLTVLLGCATAGVTQGIKVTLNGSQEVPPAITSASGSGTFVIGDDRSVRGSVNTEGVAGTAAHIHMGAAGKNGPVIVPLTKMSENVWTVPDGAKLTEEQFASYKAGDLYINVHSAKFKGGEIRGQLRP
ncbi:MAG: CHRD domain-containing protein [Betaproteobacteria bacterium]|nr:CHRD domain-containing protein [Betaproteobacteria bacterium]MDH4293531.1 CHRD domain-containing protein [Betaproteobacteria bacterium]